MNRRNLLKLIGQTAIGVLFARSLFNSDQHLNTVRRIVEGGPAQAWASYNGHGSTLINFGDSSAYEVCRTNNRWHTVYRALTESENAMLQEYWNDLHPHLKQELGTKVHDNWRLRGWIYNGRHANEWIMSVEQV